jgi:hypothetical protein
LDVGLEFRAKFVGFESQKVHASEGLDLFFWGQKLSFAQAGQVSWKVWGFDPAEVI